MMRACLLPLLLFFLLACSVPKPASNLQLLIKIVDATSGTYIKDASVKISSPNSSKLDDPGVYHVVLPVGTYDLSVTHPQYGDFLYQNMQLMEDRVLYVFLYPHFWSDWPKTPPALTVNYLSSKPAADTIKYSYNASSFLPLKDFVVIAGAQPDFQAATAIHLFDPSPSGVLRFSRADLDGANWFSFGVLDYNGNQSWIEVNNPLGRRSYRACSDGSKITYYSVTEKSSLARLTWKGFPQEDCALRLYETNYLLASLPKDTSKFLQRVSTAKRKYCISLGNPSAQEEVCALILPPAILNLLEPKDGGHAPSTPTFGFSWGPKDYRFKATFAIWREGAAAPLYLWNVEDENTTRPPGPLQIGYRYYWGPVTAYVYSTSDRGESYSIIADEEGVFGKYVPGPRSSIEVLP